jgi:dihydrofolate reductase
MKVFLIAAITADGFIGKNSNHLADWTSKEDKQFFQERTKQAGTVIMGFNTYKTIGRPLPGRENIIYAPQGIDIEGVEITQKDPKELIKNLQDRGVAEIAICGGATIYTMFMEADAVDTLYLTVEPILFGSGIKLFNKELDTNLELQTTRNLNEQSVLLEYSVLKNA